MPLGLLRMRAIPGARRAALSPKPPISVAPTSQYPRAAQMRDAKRMGEKADIQDASLRRVFTPAAAPQLLQYSCCFTIISRQYTPMNISERR